MRIKKLEINGFKSFGERAVLNFGDGITGVVGPNGCGKSNIVDSIRWCMGEMSAKHLRGRAMQDVIFAGSDNRGPLGMAEVTLTFHNDGNGPPQYAAFSEIAVTRRLHRDGTSEYLINKVQARLRDITDLFLGTGVGTRAYSIIEQGRIGFVVSSRPEERRTLIEEVAGITKFKVRKKAAERRMEATEQNLARVNDIVSELERQLASLRRQAKKAERYKEVKAELADLELHNASLEILRMSVQGNLLLQRRDTLQRGLTDAQIALQANESNLEVERLRLMEEERRLQLEQQASSELDTKLAALERDLSHWRQNLEETTARVESAALDVVESEQKTHLLHEEKASLAAILADHDDVEDSERRNMAQAQEVLIGMQAGLVEVDASLEGDRNAALEHIHTAASQRGLAQTLEKQRVDIYNRLEAATAEQQTLSERRQGAKERQHELQGRREQVQNELQSWNQRLLLLREQFKASDVAVSQSESLIAAAKERFTQKSSRLASLEEIARRFEGYSDGVRNLLAAKEAGQIAFHLKSLVSDIVTAESQYERAIEAALGDRVQYLVVDNHNSARDAIAYLREQKGGRGGFIPMAPRKVAPTAVPDADPGLLGRALQFVHSEPGYEAVAEAMLADVWLVNDLECALRVWQSGARGLTLVTLAGEVMDAHGAIAGGSGEGAGLLAKRREIRELGEEVHTLDSELQELLVRHEALEEQRLQLEVSSTQLDNDIRAAELESLELNKDCEAAAKELLVLDERLEVVAYEGEQRREELLSLDHEHKSALVLAEKAEQQKQQLEQSLALLQEKRRQAASALEQQNNALTALKVQHASRQEKLNAARTSFERLAQNGEELKNRVEKDRAVITEGRRVIEELRERIREGGESAAITAQDAGVRRQTLASARAKYEEERGSVGNVEQNLKEGRKSSEQLQQALLQVQMDGQRLELERQRLVDQIRERYDLQLLRIVGDYHLRPLPGPAEEERRMELERSIKAMGPINVMAIDECADVEKRYTFLTTQRDDLQAALDSLKRAIARINRASRERFQEAFDAVNEMFQKVFPRLFRGGEARLQLVESEDMLDAGVEIIAMPPGKKLQNVGLLSGGEKALTATALVFSIFLIKPSPFCILDEVDAPLDEANVGRFKDMLREISKVSQFIVITHNKLTMTESDRLYGITMEEPGMSKVVSVDLEQRASAAA